MTTSPFGSKRTMQDHGLCTGEYHKNLKYRFLNYCLSQSYRLASWDVGHLCRLLHWDESLTSDIATGVLPLCLGKTSTQWEILPILPVSKFCAIQIESTT